MKTIPLTKGQEAMIDDHWHEYISQWKWQAAWNETTQSYYALRHAGKYPNKTTIQMHREIMNTPKGMICDHRNHNTLDNQESNLRNVTPSQSVANTKTRNDNKLGVKGVRQRGNSFQAQFVMNGEVILRKSFPSLEEAESAYNSVADEYLGDFRYQRSQKVD